ncbi:4-hydroxyphenylacetate 3-hydroxylase N-terminal domain-containing protein [Nocardioides terrisoli]|uniref:4-hydroxyphenylacetate 3-hydroxylase N-terminal domain-containing protein n=1 Tax=Nocardioides terrisoli TaxID=3388267 RepID=UPI00287B83D3|nr:4-hydroxyphenylacetate 3-hydroxylase N-terminal domain-containing protein [Nocardioides marmorisolisilvae]
MRSGADYLESLRDGREVYVDGRRVDDVTLDSGFAGVIGSVARMYDVALNMPEPMHTVDHRRGDLVLTPFALAKTPLELARRTESIRTWAALSSGWLTRTPDHVAAIIGGLASRADVFDRGDLELGANVRSWHGRLLDESLYFTYATVPPPSQLQRTLDETGIYTQVHLVSRDSGGIVVSGAQQPGAAAAISDHIFVTCVNPLTADDSALALSFVVPVNAPGLRVHCRRSYAQAGRSTGPLAGRFDEVDALVVFDNVRVPWEDVFVCADVYAVREQFTRTPGFLLAKHQNLVRLGVKLEFIATLGRQIASLKETDGSVRTRELLGELGAIATLAEAAVLAAEVTAEPFEETDLLCPNPRYLTAGVAQQVTAHARAVQILRDLVGGEILELPSAVSGLDSIVFEDVKRLATPRGGDYVERHGLLRLAWDVIGSEFAGRSQHFEALIGGAASVKWREAFDWFDFEPGLRAVEARLGDREGLEGLERGGRGD